VKAANHNKQRERKEKSGREKEFTVRRDIKEKDDLIKTWV
jgi:hypothetical protein